MASDEDIETLVLMVGSELLTPEEMGKIIDLNDGDLTFAAAQVWEIRAGKYHGLVDITESGSSRKMSDLHKNALAMAANYRGRGVIAEEEVTSGRSGTRRITRL